MDIALSVAKIGGRDVVAVTSLQVAERFGKNHKDVLRDIRVTAEKCLTIFTERNFALSEYTDSTGRKLPMHILSKDGFMMVAMGYTTPDAMRMKEKFIHRFNEMEAQLRSTCPDFTDPVAAARAWADAMEAKRNLEQRNEQLVNTVTDLATVTTALRDALGNSIDWKSVTAIPWLREYFADASTPGRAR